MTFRKCCIHLGIALVAALCLTAIPAQAASTRLPGGVDDYTITETPYGVKFVLKANPQQIRIPPAEVDRFYFDDDYHVMRDGKLVPNNGVPCPEMPPQIITRTVPVKPDLSALNAALRTIAAGYAVEARGYDRMAAGDPDGMATVAQGAGQVAGGMKALAAAKRELER